MFIHLFKYQFLQLIHRRDIQCWVFIFPIVLSLLFFLGFGNMIINDDTAFHPIPIAVVTQNGGNSSLKQVVNELGKKGDDQLFVLTKTSEKEAGKLLSDKKIDGILFLRSDPAFKVKEEGLNQTILQSFLSTFIQQQTVIQEVAAVHPDKLEAVAEQLSHPADFNQNIPMTNSKKTNVLTHYFYALIAMTCMYGCFLGVNTISTIQSSLSALGARKSVAPIHKFKMILSDFLASVTINLLSVFLLIFFIVKILRIDLSDNWLYIIPACIAGSFVGVSLGVFFGSFRGSKIDFKESMAISFSMLCCFLSGLMIVNMPITIQHHAPIINRINPAYLLSNCFYVLNIYEDHTRYYQNIGTMLLITILFCLSSYLMLRRRKE